MKNNEELIKKIEADEEFQYLGNYYYVNERVRELFSLDDINWNTDEPNIERDFALLRGISFDRETFQKYRKRVKLEETIMLLGSLLEIYLIRECFIGSMIKMFPIQVFCIIGGTLGVWMYDSHIYWRLGDYMEHEHPEVYKLLKK